PRVRTRASRSSRRRVLSISKRRERPLHADCDSHWSISFEHSHSTSSARRAVRKDSRPCSPSPTASRCAREFIATKGVGNNRLLDGRGYSWTWAARGQPPRGQREAQALMHSNRAAIVFLFVAAFLAPPASARADKCTGAKLKTAAKTLTSALKCDSKAEAKGTAGGGASCEAKPDASLAKGFAKAEAKSSCPGSASAVLALLETCEGNAISAVGSSDTAPPASKCDSKKVAAMAKKASAELSCLTKQADKGKDPSDCLSEAGSKFDAAIGKLAAATDCSNASTAGTLEVVVDDCVSSVAGALTPSSTTTTTTSPSTTTTTSTSTTTTSTTTHTPTTTAHPPTTTTTPTSTTTSTTTTTTLATCQLGNGIEHVIHITFDNVHFTRDNPDVPSDLEQIPTLLAFIESNGTMLSNQ